MVHTTLKQVDKKSTFFLQIVIIAIAILTLCLCGFIIYAVTTSKDIGAYKPILIGMLTTVIPFFMGLYQAHKLLIYINKNVAFSNLSIIALKKIKRYALYISVFYLLCMPYIYYVAENDDAPGGIIIGMLLIIAPAIISVIAAVLQELLQSAIFFKSENDLTI